MSKQYRVMLHGWAIVAGTVAVDASSFSEAMEKAKLDQFQASWPVDECGDNVPASEGVGVSYIRDDETGNEEWPEDVAPLPNSGTTSASLDMLEALLAIRSDLKANGLWDYYSEARGIGISGACELVDSAIASAEAAK